LSAYIVNDRTIEFFKHIKEYPELLERLFLHHDVPEVTALIRTMIDKGEVFVYDVYMMYMMYV